MRVLPFWQGVLLWLTLALLAYFFHALLTGDPMDDSSYFTGLIVAFVGIGISNYYGD